MLNYSEWLLEGKKLPKVNKQYLYHFTDQNSLFSILSKDRLFIGVHNNKTRLSDDPWVSFTRNKHFNIYDQGAILVFDYDKLRNDYKVVPHGTGKGVDWDDDYVMSNQYEEKIFKDVTNLKRYLKEVIITDRGKNKPQNFLKLLKHSLKVFNKYPNTKFSIKSTK